MRPDFGYMVDDLLISTFTALLRLMLKFAKEPITRTNIVAVVTNTVGTIMLGVLAGYLSRISKVDFLHEYHDLVVSLATLYGKMVLDKLEKYIEKQKIEKYIPGAKEDESKPDVP